MSAHYGPQITETLRIDVLLCIGLTLLISLPGCTVVDKDSLLSVTDQQRIGAAATAGGIAFVGSVHSAALSDLQLTGCEVREAGRQFIDTVSAYMGANKGDCEAVVLDLRPKVVDDMANSSTADG